MNIIKTEYKTRRDKLKETFETAYDFLKYVEDLNEKGFYVQTSKNLHLFLEQNFLFYFKILTPSIILLKATPNGSIKKYDNQSEYFFSLLLENLKNEGIEKEVDLEISKTNRISLTIAKSQKTEKIFETIKLTIEDIFQKRDCIELEKQILQFTDEFQIISPVENETFSEGLKRSVTTTFYERKRGRARPKVCANFQHLRPSER
jgi:predicted HNH restriction endonuclease